MKSNIFYSWQTDLPNSINRGFIQAALEKAAKLIRDDDSINVEPVIDRDTAGVPGAPDIAATILRKIEEAQIVICDVSIINTGQNSRPTPNPNVLVELGYAMKAIGLSRIILVMNSAFGEPELLPFDLRMKRVIKYHVAAGQEDKASERKKLELMLAESLRSIFANGVVEQEEEVPPAIPLDRSSLFGYITGSRRVRALDQKLAEIYSLRLDTTADNSLWLLEQAQRLGLNNIAELDEAVKNHGELALRLSYYQRPKEKVDAGRSIGLVFEVMIAQLGSAEQINDFYRSLKYTSGGRGGESLLRVYEQAVLYNTHSKA